MHNFTELIKNKTAFTVSFEAERGPTTTSDIAIDDITFSSCTHSECDSVMTMAKYRFSSVYTNPKMFCMIYSKNAVMQDFFKLIDNKPCSLLLSHLSFSSFFTDYTQQVR